MTGAPGNPHTSRCNLRDTKPLYEDSPPPSLPWVCKKNLNCRQDPLENDALSSHLVFQGPGWSQCITGLGLGTPLAEGFNSPLGAYNETTEAITTFLSANNLLRSITAMSPGSPSSVRRFWATQGWLLTPACALCRPAAGKCVQSAP